MKTNTVLLVFTVVAFLLASFGSTAQQSASSSVTEKSSPGNQFISAYTFKVFQAPNKMYGYDIFMNNKIVLHQPAALSKQDNSALMLTKEEQAKNAAALVINKMKNNQSATLTRDEIKKLTGR
jgi:hypothetical protein